MADDMDLLLQEGEGYKVEFKEAVSRLDKEMCAFANSSGGAIYIGIADNNEIKSYKLTNKLKSEIIDIARNCDPPITISVQQTGDIIKIDIPEGDNKPYGCANGFYLRIGPNSQKMTRDEIIVLIKSEGKIRFDELLETKFGYPTDFDKNKLSRFLELARLSKTIKVDKVLLNLGVAEKEEGELYINNSGVLFFAKEPQKFIPWSVFTVVLFKDKDGADVIDRKEITGSLFEIVEQVMDFVRLYAKVAYRFTGKPQRENIYEYPFDAIREAVINSVMHKDYFEHGHNNILKFFPDNIRIENIWVRPRHFVLGKTVFRRNHLIADLFSKIDFGEKLGSGMQRMKDICKAENTPHPKIEFTDTHFYVVFKQNREYLKMIEKEDDRDIWHILNGRQRKAVEYIKTQESISILEYISLNKVSDKTARRDLNDLVEKGILKKEGVTTGLKYKLLP
ncbi:MAG: putative DNA binding domain-containing protein [Candidatus Thermoplasmatota archaeon]|nr:DeoR family transcriptional regulator [Euryarchaeota archaeon]MBU4031645.1 putative DNA binding domain-containing protein [Candidatus Thermoplasmatota archaeon]MBU4072330.1 putative DNA binding domain-containing protein [Candidatus Thermoplasmatota archaeon]MBU4143350.1 putative DNA binding domain-containing protein [Candidatus Thermoplasmatota archaeon]MBU4591176.1 putative DNA binding domain-containing protein [Candidatus Thermoplasmatota archaeon]